MTNAEPPRPPIGAPDAAADYVRFIVLGDARTGSYMLVQALNSHPNITCFSELFQWQLDYVDFNVQGYDNHSADDKALRDSDFERFLRDRIFCKQPPDIGAVGFKLLYAHIWGFSGLLERLVEDTGLRVLHLRRHNLLRMLVSTKLAEASGIWRVDRGFTPSQLLQATTWQRALRNPGHAISSFFAWLRPPAPASTPLERKSVHLSVEECNAFFFKAEHELNHFTQLFRAHQSLCIAYEDLVAERSRVLDEVQSFLGVPAKRLTVTLGRQNPEPLRTLIDNYDELRASFRETPHAAFFD